MFKKETMQKEVWVYEYGDKKIPLDAVKTFIQSIFLAVLAYFAYNYGYWGAEEYVKIAAYLSSPHCDAYGNCLSYTLEQHGNQLVWVDNHKSLNQTSIIPQPITNKTQITTNTLGNQIPNVK